jgi:hypothetical protein
VGQRQKDVYAIEALTIHFRRGGQVEHGFKINDRFAIGPTFAYQARPGRVMQFRYW